MADDGVKNGGGQESAKMAQADECAANLTRRDWLMKLGNAAILMGFSGTIESELKAGGPIPGQAESPAEELPPGLYLPSSEHLSHALMNSEPYHPIPPGSETDYVRPREGKFQPQFFSQEDFAAIKRIVQLMLGEGAHSSEISGGGSESREEISEVVAEWIDLRISTAPAVRQAAARLAPDHRVLAVAYHGEPAVRRLETADPQKICQEGLAWLEEESQHAAGGHFLGLSEGQQVDLLKAASDERPDKTGENAGSRFFDLIKAEVIHGFYTSRAGLNELDYKGNSYYATSPGCEGQAHLIPQAGPEREE